MKNWDSEIDDAAREMTRGEPDAGFKARVLARIDALGQPGARRWSFWAWSPVALAAAAVVALLVGSPWTIGGPDKVRPTSGQEVRATPGSEVGTPRGIEVRPTPGTGVVANASRGVGRASSGPALLDTVEYVGAVVDNDGLEPLEAPPALDLALLGADSMETMDSIEATRLEVAALDVPTLSAQQ